MDDLKNHVQWAKDAVAETSKRLVAQAEHYVPPHVQDTLKHFANSLAATTRDAFLRDIKELRLTAATGTLVAVAVVVSLMVLLSGKQSSKPVKPKKKKARLTRAQKVNREIQRILDFVEETYVPQIDDYIENYGGLSAQDKEYKFSYFQEMLLKELMMLDDVNVAGSDILRENRRKVIQFIQEHQTRLDKFRKENQ